MYWALTVNRLRREHPFWPGDPRSVASWRIEATGVPPPSWTRVTYWVWSRGQNLDDGYRNVRPFWAASPVRSPAHRAEQTIPRPSRSCFEPCPPRAASGPGSNRSHGRRHGIGQLTSSASCGNTELTIAVPGRNACRRRLWSLVNLVGLVPLEHARARRAYRPCFAWAAVYASVLVDGSQSSSVLATSPSIGIAFWRPMYLASEMFPSLEVRG